MELYNTSITRLQNGPRPATTDNGPQPATTASLTDSSTVRTATVSVFPSVTVTSLTLTDVTAVGAYLSSDPNTSLVCRVRNWQKH